MKKKNQSSIPGSMDSELEMIIFEEEGKHYLVYFALVCFHFWP
jgi:hypothetical protein